jgi:pimeloyl-ACP methyl ester carboxylesterase
MQDILLLHGALGAADQLQPLAGLLAKDYKVHTLSFSGHGGLALPDQPLSIELFAAEVIDFLSEKQLDVTNIFGYSMGGYVGMYLAKHHPERVNRIITLATKFHWDETIAAREQKMLDPDKIAAKLPAFAASLQERHAPTDWKELLTETSAMLGRLGQDNTLKPGDYTGITNPALVLIGDSDQMITLEETVAVFKALPAARMGMLPGTKHPIEQVNLTCLVFMIRQFLSEQETKSPAAR